MYLGISSRLSSAFDKQDSNPTKKTTPIELSERMPPAFLCHVNFFSIKMVPVLSFKKYLCAQSAVKS